MTRSVLLMDNGFDSVEKNATHTEARGTLARLQVVVWDSRGRECHGMQECVLSRTLAAQAATFGEGGHGSLSPHVFPYSFDTDFFPFLSVHFSVTTDP